jgi:hypothetical protein
MELVELSLINQCGFVWVHTITGKLYNANLKKNINKIIIICGAAFSILVVFS